MHTTLQTPNAFLGKGACMRHTKSSDREWAPLGNVDWQGGWGTHCLHKEPHSLLWQYQLQEEPSMSEQACNVALRLALFAHQSRRWVAGAGASSAIWQHQQMTPEALTCDIMEKKMPAHTS